MVSLSLRLIAVALGVVSCMTAPVMAQDATDADVAAIPASVHAPLIEPVAYEATDVAETESVTTYNNESLPILLAAAPASNRVKRSYSYKGKFAGNVAGSYDRVTALAGCKKTKINKKNGIGPLSDGVSMVFRGPMNIHNIAVYQPSNGKWNRVSSFAQGGKTVNMVFMNNKNIDYSGQNKHGPQGLATADGIGLSSNSVQFSGKLAEAKEPNKIGGGPGISTGAEVNILTGAKCNGQCIGFQGDNDYKGWSGGKKIFVTKVQMPKGGKPNQPAIWMLNAQVVHSGQYGCNCRGMGAAGGCGELDIAEVIETNAARDRVSAHYYFYDGTLNAPNGDNWGPRPTNAPTVYVTLMDESGEGLIKILELEDFDFGMTSISTDLFNQWVKA
ncbi:hypothetical protein Poli38472_014769 [Pythium oligandrum]|uniref:glucan endo-1,3-beta-D-glucosidase n=1 Tax=Pythium oligandrum TaxID=41045 RepID=A0A8K1C265_PYTOL|nr:hypothetical protein Poli38472_014769 [Pythium oligandrum]|eukprot:TMW54998.1 hypothetical protein Poli38472_014769 [Pythium oligandrum]